MVKSKKKSPVKSCVSASGRRLRRNVQNGATGDAIGLSRKEEQELNKALYASLYEKRRTRSLPDTFRGKDKASSDPYSHRHDDNQQQRFTDGRHRINPVAQMSPKRQKLMHNRRQTLGTVSTTCHRRYDELTDSRDRENLPAAPTLTTTVTPMHRLHVDESSQDSVRSCDSSASESKRKIHAIRKFASGVPLPKQARSRHIHSIKSTNPVVKMLSSKIPKTEDFLTFLCLRDSTVLPRHLDFLNNEEDSSSTSDRVSTDHQGEDMELRDECTENRSEVTESEMGCLTNHRDCNTNQSAVRARASTRDTARGLISLIKRLQSRVSTSSSSSSPSFSHLNTNLRSSSVTGQSNRKFSISSELSQSVTQTGVRHSNSKDHRIASSMLSSPESFHPVDLLSHPAPSQPLATKSSHNPPLSLTLPSPSLECSSGTSKRQRHFSRLIKDNTNNHTCSDNLLAMSDVRRHVKSSEVLTAKAAETLESPSAQSPTVAALGTSSVTACSSFSSSSLSSDLSSSATSAMPTNPEFMQPPSHMSSKPTAGLLHSHSSPCNHHPNMSMTEREGDNFTSQHNLSVHTTPLVTPSLRSTHSCGHHRFPTPKGNCVCHDSACSVVNDNMAHATQRVVSYACCNNNSNPCYNHIGSRRSTNLPSCQMSQNSCMKHVCDGFRSTKSLHESNLSSSSQSHGKNCEVCPELLRDDCLCSQGMYESAHCTKKWQGRDGISMQGHCMDQFCHRKLSCNTTQMIYSANVNVHPGSDCGAKHACSCGGPKTSSEVRWDECIRDRFTHNSHAVKSDDQNDFDEENDDIGNENMTDSDEESNSPNSRETGQDDGFSSWCCESQLPASSWSFMDQQAGFSNKITEDTSTDSMEDDVHRDIEDDSEMYDHLSYSVVSEVKHDEDLLDDKSNTALRNAEGKNDMNDKYVNERYIRRRHRIDRKKAKRSKSKYHLVREIPKLKIRIVRKNASINSANISRLEARGMPEDTCRISHNTHSRVDTTTRSADFQTEFVKMLQAGGTVTSATKKTFQTCSLKKAHNGNHGVGLTTPCSHTAQVQDDDLQEQNQHTEAHEENIPEEEILQPHLPANNVTFRDGGGLALNEQQFSSNEKSKLDNTQAKQRHVLENKVNNESVSQAASTDPMHTSESSSESSQLADSLILRDKVISAFAKFNRKDIIVSSIEASKSSWINEADVIYAFADSDSACKHSSGGQKETLSHSDSAVATSFSEDLDKSEFDDNNTVDLEATHNETSDGKQPAAQASESAANKSCDVELQVCLSELGETNDGINGNSKEKQHSVIQNPPAGRCDTFDKQCGSVKDCDEEMPEVGNKNENGKANAHKENVEKDLRDKEAVKAEKEVRINTENAAMKVMQHKENQFTQKDDEKQPDTHKVPKQMSVGTQMTRPNSSGDESEKMELKLSKHEDCELKRSVSERHTQTELMINEYREFRRVNSESQEEAETVSSTQSRTLENQSNCKSPVVSNQNSTFRERFECRTWSKGDSEEHQNTERADTSSHASPLCGDKRHEWKTSEQSMETSGSRKAEVGVQTMEDKATQISTDQVNNLSYDNTDRQPQVSDPQRDKQNKSSKSVDSICQTEITSHDDMAATTNEGNNVNCHETESTNSDAMFSSNRGVDLAMKRKRFHMSRAYAQTSCEDMPDVSTEPVNCKTSITGNVGARMQSEGSDCTRGIDNGDNAVIEGKRRMNVSMDSQADDSHDGAFCSEANDFTDLVIDLSLSGRSNRNGNSSSDSDCSSGNNRDIVSCSGNQLEIIELTTSCSINKEGRSNSRGRMSVTLEYMNEGDVLDSPIDMTIKRTLPVSSLPTEIIYSKSHSSRNSSDTKNQVTKCSCKNSDKVLTSQLDHQNKVMQNADTLENRSRLSQDTMMSRDSHENGRNFTKSNRTASSTVQNSETSQRHPSVAPRFEKSDVPVSTSNSNLQPSVSSPHSNGKSIVYQGGRNGIMNKQSKAQASAIYSENKKNPAFLSKSMDSKYAQRDEAIFLHSYGSLNTGQGFAMVNGQLQHCEILDKRNISIKKADHTLGVNNDHSRINPSDSSQQMPSGEKSESKKPVHSFSNNQFKPKGSTSLKRRKHPYERTASCPKISALPSQKFEKCSSHQRVPSNHHRNKPSCHSYGGNEKRNSGGCHLRNDSIGSQNSGGHHGVRFANSYFSLSENMDQFEISEQRNLFPALSLCLNDPPLSPVNTNDFTQFIITPRHTGRQRSNVCSSQSCKGAADHGHTQPCYPVNSGHHQINTDNFMHHREAVASRNIDPVPWRSSDTQPLASNNLCSMVQQSSGATLQPERPTQISCLARLPSQQSSSFPLSYNSQSLEGASESSEENAAQPQSTGSTVCHVQAHPSCPSTMPSTVTDTADESPENLHVASDKDILRSSYISELAINKASDTSLNFMHKASSYDGSHYSNCEQPSRPKNLSKSHSFSSGTQGNSLSSEHLHKNKILGPKEISQARTFHGKSLSFDMAGHNASFSSTSRQVPRMGNVAIPNGCSTDIASSMGNSQHQTSSAPSTSVCLDLSKSGRDVTRLTTHPSTHKTPVPNCQEISTYIASTNTIVGQPAQTISSIPPCHSNTSSALMNSAISSQASTQNSFTSNPLSVPTSHTGSYGSSSRNLFSSALPLTAADFESAISSALSTSSTSMRGGREFDDILTATYMESLGTLRSAGLVTSATSAASSDGSEGNVLDVIMEELKIQIALLKEEIMKDSQSKNSRKQSRKRSGLETLQFTDSTLNIPGTSSSSSSNAKSRPQNGKKTVGLKVSTNNLGTIPRLESEENVDSSNRDLLHLFTLKVQDGILMNIPSVASGEDLVSADTDTKECIEIVSDGED